MKKRTLKFKLIVGGILASVLPLLVVGILSVNTASDEMNSGRLQVSQIALQLSELAENLNGMVSSFRLN